MIETNNNKTKIIKQIKNKTHTPQKKHTPKNPYTQQQNVK